MRVLNVRRPKLEAASNRRNALPQIRSRMGFQARAQFRNELQALVLVLETLHVSVGSVKIPLSKIAMLPNAAPGEIVLAHRSFQGVNGKRHHGVTLPHFMPAETERVLVPNSSFLICFSLLPVPLYSAPFFSSLHETFPRLPATREGGHRCFQMRLRS